MNKPHEIALGKNAKLSCYEAFRPKKANAKNQQTSQAVDLIPCPVMVLPVEEVTRLVKMALETELDVELKVSSGHLNINGLTLVSKVLSCDVFQLDLLFPHNFPCAAPLVLLSKHDGDRIMDAQALELPWSVTSFKVEALSQKLTPIIASNLKETSHG